MAWLRNFIPKLAAATFEYTDLKQPLTLLQPAFMYVATSPELRDPATLDGMSDLITKVSPLLQGRRLHNIVDLLAAISDVIEMSDDYSSAQAAQANTPPTIWQSICRLRSDENARRGLDMTIGLMAELGRQSRATNGPITRLNEELL